MSFSSQGGNRVVGLVVVVVIVGLGAAYTGYLYGVNRGRDKGYDIGYQKALADANTTQDELAKKAAEQAAKAANPFQVENPLEGVEVNPFDDAKKALNPFAE